MSPQPLSESAMLRLLHWALSDDTGVSSNTIARVASGATLGHADIPYDGGDFGRCYRLLQAVPELYDSLPDVARVCPKWGPLVDRWHDLEAAYLADLNELPQFETRRTGRKKYAAKVNQRACYDLLSSLRDACMEADGFRQTSPGYWERRKGDV